MEKRPQKPPIRDNREDRQLPSDIGAERAILGAILLDNYSYLTAINLEAEDFILDSHRKIYLRMTDLMAAGTPVDFVTLTAELDKNHELANVGGITYVTCLTDGLPRVKNISQYVTLVKEKAKLRSLIHAANVVMESAYDPQGTADEVLAAAECRIAEVIGTPERTETIENIFVNALDFTRHTPNSIDWMVEGIIERGANGLIVAPPKTGKSLVILDLAIALAIGQSWMPGKQAGAGFYVPRPVRVAMCAREDTPGLSKWRLKKLAAARQVNIEELGENLWLNSKEQTPRLMIDDHGDMRALIAGIERRKIEFLILDVFRKIHGADENDAEEMQKVIEAVCDIQSKTGAQVCLVHHKRKSSGERGQVSSLTDSARGSSVIAGYAEFIVGATVVNPEAPKHEWVREMEVELKAAIAPDNWFCQFIDQADNTGIAVERVFWTPPKKRKKADNIAGQQAIDYKKAQSETEDEDSGGVPF